MTTKTRLRLIEGHLSRRPVPPPAPTTFDSHRLTPREMAELDELLGPIAPLPGERWDLKGLTLEQVERATDLMNKAHGIAPSPAYPYMAHRDPGIGPCR